VKSPEGSDPSGLIAKANGIQIAYEAFGDPRDPTMLLIMGLGSQLLLWDADLCRLLADRGFHVVRFDNRDVGLSTKIEDGPAPDLAAALPGDTSSASYTLEDMADDAAGLLDHLQVQSAHLVGASMGGMIAQVLAIRYPDRVRSLASVMSTTGDPSVGQPRQEAMSVLFAEVPSDRAGYVEFHLDAVRAIGSPGFPLDEDRVRRTAAAVFERSFYRQGVARQLLAVIASGDRTRALSRLDVPTVVIHGREDPLIPVSGGEATARAIPGAELLVIPGMGHDLPPGVWPKLVDAIVRNAALAGVPAD
jgi:pimeloyl-ACP methyl ester carboxylesterase